jgi:hypothetical protein
MPKRGVTRAAENRAIRQEALREQLSRGKHVQHILEMTEKLADLDVELESLDVQRLRAACENKFKLIDKYLPSLKAVEMTIPDSSALETLSTSALIKRFHELIGETSP